uniref:Trichohyalin-plectin-homology domain-containing protein n=1 Tax=Dicentrarchus labrax TaxID=13489 RepID=A0A8C4IDF7_DICLA
NSDVLNSAENITTVVSQSVLSRADWERIQSVLNQPKPKVYTRQEVVDGNIIWFDRVERKQREKQCRKAEEAQQLRKQAREDYLNMIYTEELEFKKKERQQAVDKANTKRFHQNGCVTKFNRALQKIYVQKENDALIEFNQEKQRADAEQKRLYEEEMRCRQEEALRQEQEKASQRQLYNKAVTEHQVEQMRKSNLLREKEKQQEKEERERLRGLHEQHEQELRHLTEIRAETKKNNLKNQLADISRGNLHREREAQKLNKEDKERKIVQFALKEKLEQRQNDLAERFRKRQLPIEIVTEKLAAIKEEQVSSTIQREETKFSKEVSEEDALVAKHHKDKKEKNAAALKSISAHREEKIKNKEQKVKAEQQSNMDWFLAQKQSDRLFLQKQKEKAQISRDNKIKCQDSNVTFKAEKRARLEQLKQEERDAEEKNAEQINEREKKLQQYVQHEFKTADSPLPSHLLAVRTGGHGFMVDANLQRKGKSAAYLPTTHFSKVNTRRTTLPSCWCGAYMPFSKKKSQPRPFLISFLCIPFPHNLPPTSSFTYTFPPTSYFPHIFS